MNSLRGYERGKTAFAAGHGAYDDRQQEIFSDDCNEGTTLQRPGGASRQRVFAESSLQS